MSDFASGRHAKAICDICGVRCEYTEIKEIMRAGLPTNLLACNYCWDKDHPQLFLGRKPVRDRQALRRPRPDNSNADGRAYFDKAKLFMPPVTTLLGKVRASEWYPYQATLQTDALPGPYNSGDGMILVDNTASDLHAISTKKNVADATNVTFSAIVGPVSETVVEFVMRVQDLSGVNVGTDVFTATTRTYLGIGFNSGTGTPTGRTIELLPNGWARYTVTFTIMAGAQTLVAFLSARSGGSASYLGTGSQTIGIMPDPVIS